MPTTLDWKNIDTVLLDMDGTLIDLEFDTYFWQHLVPHQLAEQQNISQEQARHWAKKHYDAAKHTLNWYCLDYWSRCLSLDIRQLTEQVGHRVKVRQDTLPLLAALRQSGRQTILLTNSHPFGLAVKMSNTQLDQHLDLLLSTHTFGYPKEDPRLWENLLQAIDVEPRRTLFIDDMEPLLDVAKQCGIGHCLGVTNPDSSSTDKTFSRHPATRDYRTLLPAITAHTTKR